MNCKEVKKYLDAYVDGELEPGLLFDLERHLEECVTCGSVVLVKRKLKSELGKLSQVKAPEHLRQRIVGMRQRRSRRKFAAVAAALPVAAAASLLLVFGFNDQPQTEEPLAAVVEDVVQRHARELPMEVEGPDPATAATWFRGKVDFPVRAPALNLRKANFEGARLSNVREHQAAQMTYAVDGHRVTLMIFNRSTTLLSGGRRVKLGDKDVLLGRGNGFNVAVLLDGDMAYALSSDLPHKRLLSLLEEINR